MELTKYKIGELIELTNEKNANGLYGEDDAIGVNIDKIIMPMRGNLEKKDFSNFHLVPPRHFAYNPRGSRKLGIGFNDTEKTFIITFNDNVFRIKETAKKKILDTYLFMYLCRKEWDRYAEFISWGSSTEVFDWNIFCEEEIFLPPIQIQSIIFIAMTYIFNNIRNMKFYTWVLEHNKYTFGVWAQAKESFAYNVTKIVETMPTFSFAPTSWDYYQMREEWYNTYNIGEKFLICIGMTLLAIRGIVGNVLIDLVFVITFLYERKVLRINSIINLVKEIDVGAIIESLVSFISENGNVILLIVFVSLAVYAMYERKKIAT